MKRPEQKLTLQAMRLNIRAILIVAGYNRKLNNMALSKLYPIDTILSVPERLCFD